MPEYVKGTAALNAKLRRMAKDAPKVFADALYEEAKIELKEAQRKCPKRTGALAKSGTVYKWDGNEQDIKVQITFGVPTPYYAIYVHEDLEAVHPNGEAKFLESTLLESAPYISQRVAKRVHNDRWGQ